MVEDIDDPVAGPHQHIDLIYFCRLRDGQGNLSKGLRPGWQWVSEETLAAKDAVSLEDGRVVALPEDVRQLGLAALRRASEATQ
jgi:hypothetical protein